MNDKMDETLIHAKTLKNPDSPLRHRQTETTVFCPMWHNNSDLLSAARGRRALP